MGILILSHTWATLATRKHFEWLINHLCPEFCVHSLDPFLSGEAQFPRPRFRWQSLFHIPTILHMLSIRALSGSLGRSTGSGLCVPATVAKKALECLGAVRY